MSKKLAAEFIGTLCSSWVGAGARFSRQPSRMSGSGSWRRVRVRPHRPDDGLRDRPHLRLSPESGRIGRPLAGGRFPASGLIPTSWRRWPARSPARASST